MTTKFTHTEAALVEKVMLMWAERCRFRNQSDYEPALNVVFKVQQIQKENPGD